jgi:hypothetical protein
MAFQLERAIPLGSLKQSQFDPSRAVPLGSEATGVAPGQQVQTLTPLEATEQKISQRQAIPFSRRPLIPKPGDITSLLKETPLPIPTIGRMTSSIGDIQRQMQDIPALLQREEAAVAGGVRPFLSPTKPEGETFLQTLGKSLKGVKRGLTGERVVELGDIARERGATEPVAATAGLLASFGLPSTILTAGLAKGAKPVQKAGQKLTKATGFLLGIEPEAIESAQKIGFRNILKKEFFDKRFPAQIQQKIESNVDVLRKAAGNKFDEVSQKFSKNPINRIEIAEDFTNLRKATRKKPFKEAENARLIDDIERQFNEIFSGANPDLKLENIGDALATRRALDDIIFTQKGKLKQGTEFAKGIRDIINKQLHKNKTLEAADNKWSTLLETLDDIKKATSDTGENFLRRFDRLPKKQQKALEEAELAFSKEKSFQPFMEELKASSLAPQFKTPPPSFSLRAIQSVGRPLFRFGTRTAETLPVRAGTAAVDELLTRLGPAIGRRRLATLQPKAVGENE